MLGFCAASIDVRGMGPDPGGKTGHGVTPETTVVDHPAATGHRPSGAADRSASNSGQGSEENAAQSQDAAGRRETRAQDAVRQR
jgi:hypothetical protein